MISRVLIIALVILVVLCILYFVYCYKFKRITTNCVTLITGAPKTGKDLLQNDLAPHCYKRAHFVWWIKTRIFKKKVEEPLFYVNYEFSFGKRYGWWLNHSESWREKHPYEPHPLDKNIRMITKDLLLRDKRVAYKSVISITEASLVNDNMLSISVGGKEDREQTQIANIEISLFYKLIGHSSRGGQIFINSQSLTDLHYGPKRVSSSFLFIQKRRRVWWSFGLFDALYVREMINADLGAVNNFESDVDDTMKLYLIFRPKVFKRYNCYEFSKFTDYLPIEEKAYNKAERLVSFNPRYIALADKRYKDKEDK